MSNSMRLFLTLLLKICLSLRRCDYEGVSRFSEGYLEVGPSGEDVNDQNHFFHFKIIENKNRSDVLTLPVMNVVDCRRDLLAFPVINVVIFR